FALIPVSAVFYVACIVCLIYHIDFIHTPPLCSATFRANVLYGSSTFSCPSVRLPAVQLPADRLSARAAFPLPAGHCPTICKGPHTQALHHSHIRYRAV